MLQRPPEFSFWVFSPLWCSVLHTEDTPVFPNTQLFLLNSSCLPSSAFLPISCTAAWILTSGNEVGQLQGSLHLFSVSHRDHYPLLPYAHCLENCCSMFFVLGFFFLVVSNESKSVPFLHLARSRSVHYLFISLFFF